MKHFYSGLLKTDSYTILINFQSGIIYKDNMTKINTAQIKGKRKTHDTDRILVQEFIAIQEVVKQLYCVFM